MFDLLDIPVIFVAVNEIIIMNAYYRKQEKNNFEPLVIFEFRSLQKLQNMFFVKKKAKKKGQMFGQFFYN